ncbi:MAG: hypothetical protein ACRDRH_21405 [Pseudonocardia sp.]
MTENKNTDQSRPAAPEPIDVLLLRDEAWTYAHGTHGTATRRLRVWRIGERKVTAVITEPLDERITTLSGPSVSNAAELVIEQLAREYPDDVVQVVEHVVDPDDEDCAEYFDEWWMKGGQAQWRRVPSAELIARLGVDPREIVTDAA